MVFKFLKDQLGFIITYFTDFFLILLFYQLSTNKSVEMIYPLAISLFIFFIFLTFKFYRYREFNLKLLKVDLDKNVLLEGYNNEEKLMAKTVESLQQQYYDTVNKISSDNLRKNKFISQWIHNMKTPVSVIDLILQRCSSNDLEFSKAITTINEENIKIYHNLDQVLDILRLEDFSKDYIPEEINLKSLVRSCINDKKNQFIYNSVFPKVEIDNNINILTDEKWSKVMIEQIISNAVKYSSDNQKSKIIKFTAEKNGSKVILSIIDNGIGIPQYDIPRIFEAFFTGKNGHKNKNSSGIGLYIVNEIAQKIGVTINVFSELQIGTTFQITYLAKL